MHKRNTMNQKLQIPTVFARQTINNYASPLTPHNPPASISKLSSGSSQESSLSAYMISPLALRSPHVMAVPATNPFMPATRDNPHSSVRDEGRCSMGPRFFVREDCCVQESRTSIQFQQAKRIPNTLTAKIGIRNSETRVDTTEGVFARAGNPEPRRQCKFQANACKRYASCGGGIPLLMTRQRGPTNVTEKTRPSAKVRMVCKPPVHVSRSRIQYVKLKCIELGVMDFLSFRDYLAYLMCSREVYSRKYLNKKIEDLILKKGLSARMRRNFWISQCRVNEIIGRAEHGFAYYATQECELEGDIEKDLDRTFPKQHRFYSRPENLKRLGRVLRAFAVKNRDIGYIQGLNFIAGHLLLQFSDEVRRMG